MNGWALGLAETTRSAAGLLSASGRRWMGDTATVGGAVDRARRQRDGDDDGAGGLGLVLCYYSPGAQ